MSEREPRTPAEALRKMADKFSDEGAEWAKAAIDFKSLDVADQEDVNLLNSAATACRAHAMVLRAEAERLEALEPQALSESEQYDALFDARHSGDSAWETLQRLHADGFAIVRTR